MVVDKRPLMPRYRKIIHCFNLFGAESEPSKIWEHFGGNELHEEDLFFFCQLSLKPKGAAGSGKINRKVGMSGTWSAENCDDVLKGTEEIIGRKRRFRYENRQSEEHGRWILEEYSLVDSDEFVICRMRENERWSGNKRKAYSSSSSLQQENQNSNKKTVKVTNANKRRKKDEQIKPNKTAKEMVEKDNQPQKMGSQENIDHDDDKNLMINAHHVTNDEDQHLIGSLTSLDGFFADLDPDQWQLPLLPDISVETHEPPLPTSGVSNAESADIGGLLESWDPINFENVGNYQESEDINSWSNYFCDADIGGLVQLLL